MNQTSTSILDAAQSVAVMFQTFIPKQKTDLAKPGFWLTPEAAAKIIAGQSGCTAGEALDFMFIAIPHFSPAVWDRHASNFFGCSEPVTVPGEVKAYAATYAAWELADLVPSHCGLTFNRNPKYQFKNDRNYSDSSNQERIIVNSSPGRFSAVYLINDNPDASNGPSIIVPEGLVLGGNNRVMLLQRVYANFPAGAEEYRALLIAKAERFGLLPADIEGMRQPVLVRQLEPGVMDYQRAITDFNKVGTADFTVAERSTTDARNLDEDTAQYIAAAIESQGPDATLNDALSARGGIMIVNHLVDAGVFTMQEKPKLIDSRTGAVTGIAKERISKMLLGSLFAESDQMQRTAPELRNKLERIVASVLRSQSKPEWSLLDVMREAIDLLEYSQAHGISFLPDAVCQSDLFGDGPQFSERAVVMAQFIRGQKPTVIAKAMRSYTAEMEPGFFHESTPEESFELNFKQ